MDKVLSEASHPELYHSVGHISQPAGKPLGVVAHCPSPHVLGQGSEHVAAACCLIHGFQHSTHLRCPGPRKSTGWVETRVRESFAC